MCAREQEELPCSPMQVCEPWGCKSCAEPRPIRRAGCLLATKTFGCAAELHTHTLKSWLCSQRALLCWLSAVFGISVVSHPGLPSHRHANHPGVACFCPSELTSANPARRRTAGLFAPLLFNVVNRSRCLCAQRRIRSLPLCSR